MKTIDINKIKTQNLSGKEAEHLVNNYRDVSGKNLMMSRRRMLDDNSYEILLDND